MIESSTTRQLRKAVAAREAERLEFLRELVELQSLTGSESAIQTRLEGAFADAGLDVRRQEIDSDRVSAHLPASSGESFEGRPNIIGVMPGSGGGRSLLLNGHVDTVSAGDESQWRHPPFSAALVDGEVWGRGACDMKAGLVACLYAVIAIRDAGLSLRGDAVIAATVGEETGGAGAIAYALDGVRTDAAIVTEPTRLSIAPAHMGAAAVRIALRGRSAHACVRHIGVSAIEKFVSLFAALEHYEAERNRGLNHPLFLEVASPLPLNVGIVRGGEAPTIVPEDVVADVRVGIAPGEDMREVQRDFEAWITTRSRDDDWLKDHPPTFEWKGVAFGPSEVPAKHEIVTTARDAFRGLLDAEPRVEGMTYGTDMTHLNCIAGIPTILFGPGDMSLAHCPNERVPVDDVRAATLVLAGMLAAWSA